MKSSLNRNWAINVAPIVLLIFLLSPALLVSANGGTLYYGDGGISLTATLGASTTGSDYFRESTFSATATLIPGRLRTSYEGAGVGLTYSNDADRQTDAGREVTSDLALSNDADRNLEASREAADDVTVSNDADRSLEAARGGEEDLTFANDAFYGASYLTYMIMGVVGAVVAIALVGLVFKSFNKATRW